MYLFWSAIVSLFSSKLPLWKYLCLTESVGKNPSYYRITELEGPGEEDNGNVEWHCSVAETHKLSTPGFSQGSLFFGGGTSHRVDHLFSLSLNSFIHKMGPQITWGCYRFHVCEGGHVEKGHTIWGIIIMPQWIDCWYYSPFYFWKNKMMQLISFLPPTTHIFKYSLLLRCNATNYLLEMTVIHFFRTYWVLKHYWEKEIKRPGVSFYPSEQNSKWLLMGLETWRKSWTTSSLVWEATGNNEPCTRVFTNMQSLDVKYYALGGCWGGAGGVGGQWEFYSQTTFRNIERDDLLGSFLVRNTSNPRSALWD